MVYQWAYGSRYHGDAQQIGSRLEMLRRENDGKLSPRDVVVDARKESSPTHSLFEWDDRKAAKEFRLVQARQLIRSVVVTMGEEQEPVRAFVSVTQSGDDEMTYTSIVAAMENPSLSAQVLMKARRELETWRKKYETYKELSVAVGAVEKALAVLPPLNDSDEVAA